MESHRKENGPDGAATPSRADGNGCGTHPKYNPAQRQAQGCPLSRCPFSILTAEGFDPADVMAGLRGISQEAFCQRVVSEHGEVR